jgi:hypothetical protein
MELKLESPQKVVDYFGLKLVVPNGSGFIATDKDLTVCWFEEQPSKQIVSWFNQCYTSACELGKLKTATGDFWENSLMEISA